MKILDSLILDSWWKAVLVLGIGAVVCSFFFKVDFVEAKHLFGLGIGMILIGISYWIAEKEFSTIKPPNAYTGPAAWLYWKEIRHNFVTIVLLFVGLALLCLFSFLIIRSLV